MNFGQWIGLLSLILSVYVLWYIRELLMLVFTAVIFATVLNRLVRRVVRFGLGRNLAIMTVLVAVGLITFLCILLIVPTFVEQFQQLLTRIPAFSQEVYSSLQKLEQIEWLPNISEWSRSIIQLPNLTTDLFKNFFTIFSNSFFILLRILFILVLTVMMLIAPQPYRSGLLRLFPSFYRRRADEILSLSEVSIANWVTGILINCIFIATLSGVGLYFLGIDFVLVHALLAGLFNFIPNIGPTASVIFPIMVAALDDPWKIIAVIIWYFIIQNIESYWLTPTVMAKQVSLLPAVTLMAQIFFTTALGILGLFLALPLTVVAKTWVEEVLFKDILDKMERTPWQRESIDLLDTLAIEEPKESLEDSLPLPSNSETDAC
ncbi:AI-2E family transporter [Gloeocapsa sp. PCC 73106]|uniref:AI-2E family transporter n=1 Tax=Gloeocapsa sp. PCC 73106 TaxID=102232 RepID=UPI0002ABEC6F|nr:AI-2E family transporter [Gloeocapsa sp. PCC 73106]ELR99994.1 putative permease [Gloeocapsa sp. PCC 73106]